MNSVLSPKSSIYLTNWGYNGISLTLSPKAFLYVPQVSLPRPVSPVRICCFEHKDLLLYFFYVSHTHSHKTRHKICYQKYLVIRHAEKLPAGICVLRVHFILPFPLQFSPLQYPKTSFWKYSSPVLIQ